MTERLNYYDVLSALVPGILLAFWFSVCFPSVRKALAGVAVPEAVAVLAFIAAAMFIGHIVQSLAALIEAALFRSWGGRPSDRALEGGLRDLLPKDSAQRIRTKLSRLLGADCATRSLFLYAMQMADGTNAGRAGRFNALYAYHQGLLVAFAIGTALLVLSRFCGAAASWSPGSWWSFLAAMVVILLLLWHRTKQRARYYAREVLLTAERVLDERQGTAPGHPEGSKRKE